jgi:methionyl-tRNA formyltransferase
MAEGSPRVLVFGYSEVGYRCLDLLLRRGVNPVAVITHEDDPVENQWFHSVPQLAARHSLPTYKPATLKETATETLVLKELRPDLIFSFYYRHMIPMRLLRQAGLGAFNLHGSFLPKYRGRAPVNWAVLNGEDHTGATLHYMVGRADAGDIVDQERGPIGPRDTAAQVTERVVEAAVRVLDRQIENLLQGTAPRTPQDEAQATYFGGRKPEDGRIDWTWPTQRIFNLIRAVTKPYPGAFADFPDGRQLLIWWAEPLESHGSPGQILSSSPLVIATGDGALHVTDFEWRSSPVQS